MKNLLVINSSPRTTRSYTRKLTATFVEQWKIKFPDSKIVYRDVGLQQIPHVCENWIAGAFKPAEQRTIEEKEALRQSDECIRELKDSDVIVIGAPMYNYSITSSLKAYFDQILRVNETWVLNPANMEDPYVGQLKDKKLFLLLSRGAQGYESGGYNEKVNFQTTYLRAILKMMGIFDVEEITVDGELFGEKTLENSVVKANDHIKSTINNLMNRISAQSLQQVNKQ